MQDSGRDLVGVPWSEMNCGALAREVLRRRGVVSEWIDALVAENPSDEVAIIDALMGASGWARLGNTSTCATEPGDVILSRMRGDEQYDYHLSVMVDRVFALTTSRSTGAILIRPHRIASIVGVWRWLPT